jgi:hypothetical protein
LFSSRDTASPNHYYKNMNIYIYIIYIYICIYIYIYISERCEWFPDIGQGGCYFPHIVMLSDDDRYVVFSTVCGGLIYLFFRGTVCMCVCMRGMGGWGGGGVYLVYSDHCTVIGIIRYPQSDDFLEGLFKEFWLGSARL